MVFMARAAEPMLAGWLVRDRTMRMLARQAGAAGVMVAGVRGMGFQTAFLVCPRPSESKNRRLPGMGNAKRRS